LVECLKILNRYTVEVIGDNHELRYLRKEV